LTKQWLYVIDEAVKRIENDEIELGLQALQKVREHGKQLPDVMLYLADVWVQLGHLHEAAVLLQEILAEHPVMERTLRFDCQLLLAEICLAEDDFEQAQSLLYSLKEEGCEDMQLYLLLADLYAAQELDEVAVKYLEEAYKREPHHDELISSLAEMYFRLGQHQQGMDMLAKMKEPSAEALLYKGRVLAQNGELEAAYATYHQLLQRERSSEALYGCALMAFHLGRLEEAGNLCETLLALDEEYMAAYPLLADIHLSLGKPEKAIQALIEYVELSGYDLDQIRRLIALLQQSGRYEEAKKYQELHDRWKEDEE